MAYALTTWENAADHWRSWNQAQNSNANTASATTLKGRQHTKQYANKC